MFISLHCNVYPICYLYQKDNYTEYIIVDNFDNYYTIKENGIMDYTILSEEYSDA